MAARSSGTPAIKKPNIQRASFQNWLKGTVTALDDGRTPTDGLRSSGNVMLDQDGTIRPRPSLVRYGSQPVGTILGEMFEFVRAESGVNVTYRLTAQNVAGVTSLYYAKDGNTWTIANGKTYNASAPMHFVQIDNKVLAMNGVDNLSYFDIPTLAVIPFTVLATPSIASVVATNLTGTNFSYYYKVTANSTFGETAASASMSVQVSTERDLWIPASGTSPQYVTVTWNPVSSANSYNVYMASVSGDEVLLATGINGTTFKDDGTFVTDVSRAAPLGDTTAGAKVTRGTAINGQVYLTGDTDNPRYVRFGGTGVNVLDFSAFNGGGWVELGRGTKEVPVIVKNFRDGHGNIQITALCRGTNGVGKRYFLTPSTITVGTIVISYLKVDEDYGQEGTDSPDAVIAYEDSLWYPSRDGFKTTGTKPQLQNLLSTDYISDSIVNDVASLSSLYMPSAVGMAYKRRLYFALPNGATTNNEIWVLDLARGGAWMKPWSIAASWMMMYNSNDGNSHHLIVSNNIILELTDSQITADDGVAFATNANSGIIKFSEDGLEWSKVIDVTFIILRPQGVLNFTIAGKTEDSSSLLTVGSNTFTSQTSVAGWGEAGWGGYGAATGAPKPTIFGWSNFSVVPLIFGNAQTQITIEIDEELQWWQWGINSTTAGTFFQLSDIIVRYVDIGVKDLT